jgi:c-di-GMP-binding flagellar brake protein YcgR
MNEIKIGTRLELELINGLGEKIGQTYISQIIDIKGDNIVIAVPIRESRVLFIPIGSKARMYFFHNKYGLLSLEIKLDSKTTVDNIQCIIAHAEGPIEKIQRRKYYRLDCNLPVNYRICREDETQESLASEIRKPVEKDVLESEFKKGLTKNLSGSGLCIVIDEKIDKDSMLEVFVWMDETNYIRTVCSIMRISEVITPRDKKHDIGLHILSITERGQNLIIKYVFEKQKEILKRQTM